MNVRTAISHPPATSRAGGFTMLEIAIALGVIAFALIAIIGILPTGLQTQRDTREETIVNQDARLLVEAIRTGGRDLTSDIGAFVKSSNGFPIAGIPTSNFIQLLSDIYDGPHTNVLNSITGSIVGRGSDLGFHYQVISTVTEVPEFSNTPLSNQVFEVRLRFAWPVMADFTVPNEANRYVVRTLVTGTYKDRFLYAQHHWNANYTNAP